MQLIFLLRPVVPGAAVPAAAGIVGIRRLVPPLARYNIPAPVIGGLLVAIAIVVARSRGATVFAVVQNLVGMGVALALGAEPLLGVLAGSVTLTGGPATGLAFAPLFEEAGVRGAASVAVAAAMVGIVFGGVIGAPLATRLIDRFRLSGPRGVEAEIPRTATQVIEEQLPDSPVHAPESEDEESYVLLKSIVTILIAMWVGSWLSAWFASMGLTLPGYIGAMLVAATIRNVDDFTGRIGLSQRIIDDLGNVALSLFIVLALMTLQLWEIAALAVPLVAILAAQLALIGLWVFLVFRLMGRDYDAAVMSGGFCGFMLGTTANAMANMRALVERYGPAPRAFLVVPMVGAFFIDFTNAVIITAFVNLLR